MLLNMVMFKVIICDFGKMNINMTGITEKTENGELVTNRDQLVVVDNIESLIKVIRGQQVMLDRDLATLYGVETKRLNEQVYNFRCKKLIHIYYELGRNKKKNILCR